MWKLHFRMRFLLLAFALACILMATWAITERRLRENIREVEELGGLAYLNCDCDCEGQVPGPFLPERDLPSRIAYFWSSQISPLRRIVSIHLNGTQVSDADLKRLSGYGGLMRLDLSHTQVSDAGLVHLTSLKELRVVGLYDTNVTKAGVAALGKQNPTLAVEGWDSGFDELIEEIMSIPENSSWQNRQSESNVEQDDRLDSM